VAEPLRILLSTPAYWPAHSFGGPVPVIRRLAGGLVERGHVVDVFASSLSSLEAAGSWRTRVEPLDGASVHYLATPLRFRWMGFTLSLPLHLARTPRADIAHVFGFRDPIGTAVAAWCRAQGIPYVFEGLGMVTPKLRKLRLKRLLDATALRGVLSGASLLVAASELERREYLVAGMPEERTVVRPNGFPEPLSGPRSGALHKLLGLDLDTPVVLNVGRVARGKGLELLVRAAVGLNGAHVALVGPDGGHGMTRELLALRERLGLSDRVHLLGPLEPTDLPDVYADADIFALPSSHENFGMVAAEAAAAGTPVIVTNRCGIAERLASRGAIVVPYDENALRAAILRLLEDAELRRRLGEGARAVAAEWSWPYVVSLQEEIYRRALAGA